MQTAKALGRSGANASRPSPAWTESLTKNTRRLSVYVRNLTPSRAIWFKKICHSSSCLFLEFYTFSVYFFFLRANCKCALFQSFLLFGRCEGCVKPGFVESPASITLPAGHTATKLKLEVAFSIKSRAVWLCYQLLTTVRPLLLFQLLITPKRRKLFPYKIFIVLYFKRKNQINSILKGTLKM